MATENLPRHRPFTSPGRTNSVLSPAAHFHGDKDEGLGVDLTTSTTTTPAHQRLEAPAGSLGISTTATGEAVSSFPLPRNLIVSDLPPQQQQASPYIQYLYGALNRGQGYSTTNSARTSYTRVESMAFDENSEQEGQPEPEPEAEVEVEEGNNVEQIQAIPQIPIVSISFLLISGKRRVMTFEPETTVGRVKELVWNSWPTGQDWQEERPPTPSHLRVLHLGKILQDEDTLKICNFPIHTPTPTSSAPAPTIVHLAIRPSGPGIPNPGANADLEKRKSKIARSRLVARFSSVGEAPTLPAIPPTATGASNIAASQPSEDESGCTCCVVC